VVVHRPPPTAASLFSQAAVYLRTHLVRHG
jgi:hypothetical protein